MWGAGVRTAREDVTRRPHYELRIWKGTLITSLKLKEVGLFPLPDLYLVIQPVGHDT